MKKYSLIVLVFLFIATTSCKKDFLETKPTDAISDVDVFNTPEGALTVIDGTLRSMRDAYDEYPDQFGVKAIDLGTDLMGEDIVCINFFWFGYYYMLDNNGPTYRANKYIWSQFYQIISNMNYILVNIDDINSGNVVLKENVKAQALAFRAYAYFRLIQYFQNTYFGHEDLPGVPLLVKPSKEGKGRGTVQQVYDLILADLTEAISLFDLNPMDRLDISHIDGNVARGLRARVALVQNQWEDAASFAASARNGYAIMSRADFQNGFANATAQNWMWGLPVNDEQSTLYSSWFSHMDMTIDGYAGLGYSPKFMSSVLYSQMDPTDIRTQLIDENMINYKFSAGDFSGDYVMMRAEEMLLIEAEAQARLGNDEAAQELLVELRNNRYSAQATVTTIDQALINEILLERRIELWGEGFSLLDIKRLKKGLHRDPIDHDPVVAFNMDVPVESPIFTFMLPQEEIDNNPSLTEADQNPSPGNTKKNASITENSYSR
jgi:starch-binding outer membrane protein, SusD/RagB family